MTPASDEATLSVRDLSKFYGSFHAVRGVSFDIREGEFYTLLGPSGCGKSTTLRCVAGLERIDDGSIAIGDTTVNSSTPHLYVPPNRRDIGMVFQSYGIWPHMNVFDNVAFPITVWRGRVGRREVASRTEEALAAVQMSHLSGRRATELSGGQQQRVALARAIVARPKLLLLDEPLSNLDAGLRESMRSELRKLQKNTGITTLFVTHDQTEALSMSDRVAVMREGVIVQEESPQEIYTRPADLYVASFLGRINRFDAVVKSVESDGRTGLQVGDTMVRTPGRKDLSPGNRVVLAIRPEAMRLRKEASADVNGFRGVVRDSDFIGEAVDYRVAVDDTVVIVRENPRSRFAMDDKVVVEFNIDDGLVYAEDTDGVAAQAA